MAQVDGSPDDLAIALVRFMRLFAQARTGKFGGDQPAVVALRECAAAIERLLPEALAGASVKPSVGQGNWAAVPWVAVLHPLVTATTQHGIYPVLLFHENLEAVEVTIAQGVTDVKLAMGRRAAVVELERRSEQLRPALAGLVAQGFELDRNLELGDSSLGRDYVASTVVHRRFSAESLAHSDVSGAVAALLEAYGELLVSGALSEISPDRDTIIEPQALVVYVGQSADANFESGGRAGWWGWKHAPGGLENLRPGDLIAFGRGYRGGSPRVNPEDWQRSEISELVVGRVTTTPERTDELVMPDELRGEVSYPWKLRFELLGSLADLSLGDRGRLSEEAVEALRKSAINRGVGLLVPIAGSPLLEEFMGARESPVATPGDVATAAGALVEAVEASGLRMTPERIRAFFSALATKPFVILTGQSGSGKTQLAMRFGDWIGADSRGRPRCLVVPVRPDWTGPEYLFGYVDVLRSGPGNQVWAVPDALEFILRAHAEPEEPYLLVLDEMNLAHVERYFADFLSGIESRQPVLPDLVQLEDDWIARGNTQRLPVPRNLLVVGTVNVDETTYMFSPKVLDRAFTFEFRTAAVDLDPALRRPTVATPGDAADRRTVVNVLADDNWQHANPHPDVEDLTGDLVALHELLSPSGHEFGHRVLYESMRYAALLNAAGIHDRWAVLDQIVLTKLLPKMHGTRTRIEKPLRELRAFAGGNGNLTAEPRMPLSARKLDRMLEVLVEAQFVSFTE